MTDAAQEIIALDAKRCAAIGAGDWDTVADLVTEDLVHIHTTGQVQTKAEYLAHAKAMTWISVERGELKVRDYGDVAVVTGPLINTIIGGPEKTQMVIQAVATQVWNKASGTWKQCSFHACRAA